MEKDERTEKIRKSLHLCQVGVVAGMIFCTVVAAACFRWCLNNYNSNDWFEMVCCGVCCTLNAYGTFRFYKNFQIINSRLIILKMEGWEALLKKIEQEMRENDDESN
ncbi:MAG: hypothetical protein COU29_00945 [Candidatus Magasanikbacteria bacterium CG10_big_fil_rev_8_21_14_0_10_36_32]|uniref:Uncharacterized protein n=1 Tax=Candidatus Magasanikbacteria bacterium CG10_big_fil_rev_8_21_14_0_10_36_32 TaxID=1974646 RepID=A0A2M6W6D5_9BACT|nr:MAG: hypothetical protein COU29_00945 [Candidatus Magasanikbacteria bacterium CG10_big_fil_rev_8_21_14_0_10_36_32]